MRTAAETRPLSFVYHGILPKSYLLSVYNPQSGAIILWLIVCDGFYLQ